MEQAIKTSFTLRDIMNLRGTTEELSFTIVTGYGDEGQVRARALSRAAQAQGLTGDFNGFGIFSPEWIITLKGNAFEVAKLVMVYERSHPEG